MSGSYLKLVIDDITRDVFPSSKLSEKPYYLKLVRLSGVSLLSASAEEYTAFKNLLAPLDSRSAPGRPSASYSCKNCGGSIIGDGCTDPMHCENVDSSDVMDREPDAPGLSCKIHFHDEAKNVIEENPRSGSLAEASPRRSLPIQALSILLISLLLSSCAPIQQGQRDSLPLTPAPLASTIRPAGSVSVEITQPEATAETRLVSEPKEKRFIPPKDIAAGVRMDFDSIDIRDFIQVVAESLGISYVLEPSVSGTVTVHTGQTFSGPQLFAAFREILQVHGLDIRHDGSVSVVYPVSGVKKRYDLGGLHVRLIAVQNAPTSILVAELQQALAAIDPGHEGVQVISLDRLQSVMILARDASMVDTASRWVRDLDTIPADARQNIYLYRVRCGLASDLARLINSLLYSDPGTSSASSTWSTSPNYSSSAPPVPPSPATARADSISPAPVSSSYQPPPVASSGQPGRAIVPTIIPDDSGNVLLMRTTAGEHSRIVKVLDQLDVVPRQVLIDVLVAEVTLGDTLGFGVEWALKSGAIKIGGSKLNPTAVTSFAGVSAGATGGFAFALLNSSADPIAVLNALQSQTDVTLLSSPQIFVQNNKTALVKVGDRVPIVTTQTERIGTDQPTTDKTVTYNDTGTILNVTPRIHHDGMVSLEVTQQVSNAIANRTSSISSPVIQTREIKTSLSIRDGQPVILGGLISRSHTTAGNKVPFLGDLPGIGRFFRFDGVESSRTELLVMITPHVVYADSLDQFQANYKPVAANLRGRLHSDFSQEDRLPVSAR